MLDQKAGEEIVRTIAAAHPDMNVVCLVVGHVDLKEIEPGAIRCQANMASFNVAPLPEVAVASLRNAADNMENPKRAGVKGFKTKIIEASKLGDMSDLGVAE